MKKRGNKKLITDEQAHTPIFFKTRRFFVKFIWYKQYSIYISISQQYAIILSTYRDILCKTKNEDKKKICTMLFLSMVFYHLSQTSKFYIYNFLLKRSLHLFSNILHALLSISVFGTGIFFTIFVPQHKIHVLHSFVCCCIICLCDPFFSLKSQKKSLSQMSIFKNIFKYIQFSQCVIVKQKKMLICITFGFTKESLSCRRAAK